MIPCPRLPVFVPEFAAQDIRVFQERGVVDGVDPAFATGLLVGERDGQRVLLRKEGGEVAGKLVWLDTTRYDEAISLMDVWGEGSSERIKYQAYDTRTAGDVDCWIYLCRGD